MIKFGEEKDIMATQNQNYLLTDQYKDGSNFKARTDLYRFSKKPYGFTVWIFDHFKLPEGSNILEIGCGPGGFWAINRKRIPESWKITLTDFSSGMLEEARNRLGDDRFSYQVADAQDLPFPDASFDAVLANRMLYHVPDLPRTFREIQRVLKPGGCLYATTLGREYFKEVFKDLLIHYWPEIPLKGSESRQFIMENGQEKMAPFFTNITSEIYKEELIVTEAEPLSDFILSLGDLLLPKEKRDSLPEFLRQEFASRGPIHITSVKGIFLAYKSA